MPVPPAGQAESAAGADRRLRRCAGGEGQAEQQGGYACPHQKCVRTPM